MTADLPYQAPVEDYITACLAMRGQLDPTYHPTADGAVKMIPHRGNPAAADDIRATFTALTSPVIVHDQPGGPALTSLADLPGWSGPGPCRSCG